MPVHYSQRLFPITLWTAQTLTPEGTSPSPIISCLSRVPDILMFRVTAASGAASVKIEYAISNDGVNFNDYTTQTAISPATATDFTTNPEEYHMLNCPTAPFLRLRITELAGLTSIVDATLWMREL